MTVYNVTRNQYAVLYDMYANFQKSYYGKDSEPILKKNQFPHSRATHRHRLLKAERISEKCTRRRSFGIRSERQFSRSNIGLLPHFARSHCPVESH